jgi:hypothetical protein
MNVTRGFAVAAAFAAVPVGAAAPASAAPVMSGHYIETETAPDGRSSTNDWYFTPCGDGCADVSNPATRSGFRATLVNGQWTMDSTDNVVCSDGTTEDNSTSAHYTWDPNTLAGTVQRTQTQPVCGHAPKSFTYNVQLRQAP